VRLSLQSAVLLDTPRLGWRNDVAVGCDLLLHLEREQPENAAHVSFSRGYLAACGNGQDDHLRKTWKTLRKMKKTFKARRR